MTMQPKLTRQIVRRALRAQEYLKLRVAPDFKGKASEQPLPRKERRCLARALAAKAWRVYVEQRRRTA